ncbi:hypothetical protein [Microvirga sp. G4-2]|uniref:hypothetical protein n=1 Tax=Microvirga sp. G4-2 TaxID=3434467 RepID=UPI0040443E4F
MCFSTPKMTPPKLPSAAPEPAKFNDADVSRVRDDAARRARASSGAASTIRAEPSVSAGTSLYGGAKTLLGQ